ncbi:hypothetical protein [Salipiger mucosus]|uniref:hypothetical protein n=1 Tax=Salipiger mucosus TaxID=263378 RepID=UPI0012EBAED5|nr:hypothetical protein [Salipiger mucosus]
MRDQDYRIEIFRYLKDRFGAELFLHPERQRIFSEYRFILDSLVESKDLVKTPNGAYNVSPQALNTLSQIAIEDRQHRDAISQQRKLNFLTAALILVTLVAALVGN